MGEGEGVKFAVERQNQKWLFGKGWRSREDKRMLTVIVIMIHPAKRIHIISERQELFCICNPRMQHSRLGNPTYNSLGIWLNPSTTPFPETKQPIAVWGGFR